METTIDPRIYDAVANAIASHGIRYSNEEFMSKDRNYHLVLARSTVMYFLRSLNLTPMSLIGKATGRDHSTVVYNLSKYPGRVETELIYSSVYAKVCEELGMDKKIKQLAKPKPAPVVAPKKKVQKKSSYVKPLNYTAKEKRAIAEARRRGAFSDFVL